MKRDTVNYVAVGGFVLAMLAALAIFLLAITGRGGPSDHYYVYYRNVSGLKYGTPVYYQGYGIGQVERITPEHNGGATRYRVDLGVQRHWPIPRDSVATVMATGLLADVSISIVEGSSRELLQPGTELSGQEGGDLFVVFNEIANEIRILAQHHIRPLVEQLGGALGEGGPVIADLRRLLATLNEGADGLSQMVGPDNRQELSQILRRLNDTSSNAQQLSAQLLLSRRQLDELLAQADALLADVRPDARQSARELRVSLQAISERIDSVMHQLDATSRNMQEFSREIRANPARLLSGTPPEDAAKR